MPKKHNHQSLRTLQRRRLYSATPCIALRNMLTQQTLEERQPTFAAIENICLRIAGCFAKITTHLGQIG
jgi:hypothetical protein